MRAAGRLRRKLVRRALGADLPRMAGELSHVRHALDREIAASASRAKGTDLRLRDALHRIRRLQEQLGRVEAGQAALTRSSAQILDAIGKLGVRLSVNEQHLAAVRSLAESARDDIPGLRQQLAVARAAATYEDAFTDPEPLVSVRIAAYRNTEALMERAVASVLRQSYQNFELIVVNDGPNPDSRKAIDDLNDPRVCYVELPFRRVYPADPAARWMVAGSPGMNEGARRASGSWIAPLDDDDEFSPDHIERLLALAQTERAELAYGALDRFDVVSGEHERIYAYPPRRGGFTFQGAIYHAGLRFFEYDEESWRVEEPGDWNLCRRMMQAGVRMVATDAVVGTMYRIPFTDKEDEDATDPVR